MSFKDIFKKSFLSQFNSDLSTTSIIMALLITAVIAVYIFAVYRVVCRKAFYSRSFAISLPVIAMITASVIIAVQSSIVISLGMVGALSIVRFRTAVKDPKCFSVLEMVPTRPTFFPPVIMQRFPVSYWIQSVMELSLRLILTVSPGLMVGLAKRIVRPS